MGAEPSGQRSRRPGWGAGCELTQHPAASPGPARPPASQKCHLKPPRLLSISTAVLPLSLCHHRGHRLKGNSRGKLGTVEWRGGMRGMVHGRGHGGTMHPQRHPNASHVGAGDARTDATSTAHHGAARAEHQQGLQAAGKLCAVLAVDLGGETGASAAGEEGAEPAASAARGVVRAGGQALPCWSGMGAGDAAA